MNQDLPLVTIGIPVYNGEKFLKRRLESILNQNYSNFQVFISDNASTDKTSKLCEEYTDKEKNIHYFRQKKNIGAIENFNHLIKNANGKYFVLAAVDDIWEPQFLEKNVNILESNDKIVGSIGNVKYFGDEQIRVKSSRIMRILKKITRRQDVNILENHVLSVSGEFNQKASKYLRFNQGSFIYGLFRTRAVQKHINSPMTAWDLVFILNILKFGDLHVIDEVLLHKYTGGLANNGIIGAYRRHEIPFYDLIIPYFSLFRWAKKNIGISFCIRNLDWFILLAIYGWYATYKKV